jgi:uncharacterized protein (TIGR03492 family)
MKKRVRVISNGFGEDAIAVSLLTHIDQKEYQIIACPLVGDGGAYKRFGVTPIIDQSDLPSGGFLRRPMDVINDISSGVIGNVIRQRQVLAQRPAELQIVVGDVFALIMATWKNTIPTIFLPTAKSERAIPHLAVEFMAIKRCAKMVFPRDIETHEAMIKRGIQSTFFGNPMFDGIQSNLGPCESNIVGILPGSRSEAIGNMTRILQVIAQMDTTRSYQYVVALSPNITFAQLQQAVEDTAWRVEIDGDGYVFHYSRRPMSIQVSHQFMDVLHQSSVVIGLAGTANEQAMFAGRPLISFIGTGPQSTKKRFVEQHRLIDGATAHLINSKDTNEISKQTSAILNEYNGKWQALPNVQDVASKIVECCLNT